MAENKSILDINVDVDSLKEAQSTIEQLTRLTKEYNDKYGKFGQIKLPSTGGDGGQKEDEGTNFLKGIDKYTKAADKAFKEVNKTLGKTTSKLKNLFVSAISWASAIALLAVGGGAFGYKSLASKVANDYSGAQGKMVTTGEMKAANNIYENRIGNVDGLLQMLARAKIDQGSDEGTAVLNMGLDPRAGVFENLPKLLQSIVDRAGNDPALAYTQLSAYGMDKYVPPEQLNQLIANKDQLPQLAQQAKEVAPKLNMTDASQRGLQSLGTTLSNSGDKIFAAFVQAIEKLNGPIETLSKTFSNAVADFLIGPNGQAVFDVLSDGLNKFSSWISSPKFQQDLKDFGTCVADVVTGLARFITFLSDPRKFAAELEKESSFTQPGDENKPKDGSVVGFAVAAGKTMIGIGTTIWDSTAGGGINELNRQSGALIGGNDPRGVDMAPQDEDRKLRMYGYSQYKQWAASVGRLSGISGDITRGKMGFNPGNLVDVGQKGAGIIGKDYGGQAIFDTLENGVIANLKQLKRNINGQNRNNLGFRYDTIDKLVESWDKTEGEAGIAGRASYKKMIGNALGLKPTDQLDTANADQMAILFKHMAKFETGMDLPANDLKRIYLQLDVKQQPGSDIQTQLRSADAGIPVGVRLGG